VSAIATLFAFVYRQARGLVGLAMLVGLLSGAAGAAQVALLNAALAAAPAGVPIAAGGVAPAAAGGVAPATAAVTARPAPPDRRWLALAAAFALLLLIAPAARLASQYLLVKLGQDMLYDLRLRLAGRILATPLPRLEQLGAGKLLAALTDDVGVITEALIVIPEVASNSALFAAGLAYLGWLSPALLAVFLLLFGPVLAAYRRPIASSFVRYREARDEEDALYGFFTGITAGTKELKLNRERRADYLHRMAATAGELRRLFTRANLTLAAVVSTGWTFFLAVVGVIVFASPFVAPVPRATLVGYVLVLLYIRGPLQQVITSLSQLGRGGVALDKIERLGLELRQDAEPAAPALARRPAGGAGECRPEWQRLELDRVTFAFPRAAGEADFVLGPLDLVLRPGELVFLIGGNGSGKTSLAKLITGLYEPAAGEIRWDGEPIDRARLDRYRQGFSAVFFDFHLFDQLPGPSGSGSDSGFDNGSGSDTAAGSGLDERARRHLRELELEDKVEVTRGRLSTTALSQGQRKRLALLAAWLEDRPLYLFDEWAADQDPYFKEVFYRRLLPRLKAEGKTALVISHDDRYFDVADRVVRLSEGQIVFDGPVHDLAELRRAMFADCAPRPLAPAAEEVPA
jgi:putative ATP-binding cassette transporter